MKDSLHTHLSRLKQTQPDTAWRCSARDFILAQCTEKRQSIKPLTFIESLRAVVGICWSIQWSLLARPVAVSAAVFLLVLTGSGIAVQAAKSSLPGDMLYPVKLATEQVQISLTWKGPARTKLNAEFATRRLDEATTIVKNPATPKEHISRAITDFTERLDTAKKDLEAAKQDAPAREVVEAAKALDAHAKEYEEKLSTVKHELPAEANAELEDVVNAAVTAVDDASTQSLQTLVEQADKDGEVTKAEVKSLLEERISDAVTLVASLPKDGDKQSVDALNEARLHLENNNLAKALEKVVETKAIVREAEASVKAVILEDDGLDDDAEETVVTPPANTVIPHTDAGSITTRPTSIPKDDVNDIVDKSETPGAIIIEEK